MASKKRNPFVMVRTYSAGVFAGHLVSRKGKEVELAQAIRIWYWAGAASLSQLAMEGTKAPDTCKFAVPMTSVTVTEAIEIIAVTPEAEANIKAVPSWRM